jgi:hypothetical protein
MRAAEHDHDSSRAAARSSQHGSPSSRQNSMRRAADQMTLALAAKKFLGPFLTEETRTRRAGRSEPKTRALAGLRMAIGQLGGRWLRRPSRR